MIRSILISAVLHGLFITMILLAPVTIHESSGFADRRIRIRINSSLDTEYISKSSAVENKNPLRTLSSVAQENASNAKQDGIDDESAIKIESADEFEVLLDYEPLVSPKSNPSEQMQDVEVIDPLINFDEQPDASSSFPDPWLINWESEMERGILSFPVVDSTQFPQNTEKLLDVVIKIKVSPQGEVLSAELVPPGSGDTRIDRYMHGIALQLALEPRFEDERVQEAHLRFLFLEDSL